MNHKLFNLFCVIVFFSGCASLSTLGLEQEVLKSDQRVMTSAEAAEIVNQALKSQKLTYSDTVQNSQVTEIINRIAKAAGSRAPFTARLYQSSEVNAFSIGGKYVFVSSGILEMFKNDESLLAGVLGHEIAHDIAGHHQRRQTSAYWQNYAASLAAKAAKGNQAVNYLAKATSTLFALQYSRSQEKEADILGTIWASKAGYQPDGLMRFFEKTNTQLTSGKLVSMISTHPVHAERIQTIQRVTSYLRGELTLHQIHAQDPQMGKVLESLNRIQTYQTQNPLPGFVPKIQS